MIIYLIFFLIILLILYKINLLKSKKINHNYEKNDKRIIFILPNIYESINGVSNKYINFINYLATNNYQCIILSCSINNNSDLILLNDNIIIKNYRGITPPVQNNIKAPVLTEEQLNKEIINGDEIIIFNGEFLWLYNNLKNIKIKHPNIKLFPTWHTDYEFYISQVYNSNIIKYVPIKLIIDYIILFINKNIFNGIIVTGEHMKDKFKRKLIEYKKDNIFNANELNLDTFKDYKIDNYNNNYNIIYCGRISEEKNIIDIFKKCNKLIDKYNIKIHIIGDGPYKITLIKILEIIYPRLFKKTKFYGEMKADEIKNLYLLLNNRIFIFCSQSETFGKTPMEAGICGIPCFIKESYISKYVYKNKKNALIFNNLESFIKKFNYFNNLIQNKKEKLILNNIKNIKKYDQKIIFKEWEKFIENTKIKEIKVEYDNIIFYNYLYYLLVLGYVY